MKIARPPRRGPRRWPGRGSGHRTASGSRSTPPRNRGTHLLDPVGGAVVEDLAGAQAPQVIVVGRAGHAKGAGTDGRRDLHSRTAHASRGGDEHGFPQAWSRPRSTRPSWALLAPARKQTGVHPLARTKTPAPSPAASTTQAIPLARDERQGKSREAAEETRRLQGPTPAPRTLITESRSPKFHSGHGDARTSPGQC